MFQTFIFVGYFRGTSNYSERITLFGPTHMMSMTDPLTISVEILRIDSGCSLEKEFTELIRMNPLIVIIPNYQSGLFMSWWLTDRFCASLKHKNVGQTKFIKPNSQR